MLDRLTENCCNRYLHLWSKRDGSGSHHPFRQGADLRRRRPTPGASAFCRQTRRHCTAARSLTSTLASCSCSSACWSSKARSMTCWSWCYAAPGRCPSAPRYACLDAWRMKLRPLLQNNLRGKSRQRGASLRSDDRLYQLFSTASASTPAPISNRVTKTWKRHNWPRSAISPPSC